MNSRLIPWCLAATGFLAALSVFTWQGELRAPSLRVQRHAAMERRIMPPDSDHHEFGLAQPSIAGEEPETASQSLILPLPPATQSEPDPGVQPVPDDEPTVEDLPMRPRKATSSEDE
jgi:hypothetical protein